MVETTGNETYIDIIIDSPKCAPVHNHTITIPQMAQMPVAFRPFRVSDDNKKLIFSKDLNVRQSTDFMKVFILDFPNSKSGI